jgi:protein SCO1
MRRGRILVLGMLLAACGHRASLPYYTDRTLTPVWPKNGGRVAHRVGDFRLLDQAGRAVTADSVRGRVYVAAFFYASCHQVCPKIRSQLTRVASAFATDDSVMILSHTIAPESDSVVALARYARANAIDGRRWRLLTGERPEIERLASDAYFVELRDSGGKTTGRLLHTETIVLVDESGHIRGLYDGTLPYDISRLIEDIRVLRSS